MTIAIHHRGFTLIELLVATALVVTIVTVSTTALYQMLMMTRRLQARQDMNAAAALLYDGLYRSVSTMNPCAAVWLRSDAVEQSVELVFLKGKEVPKDFSGEKLGYTDLVWTRWYWKATTSALPTGASPTGTLLISESRSARNFQVCDAASGHYWTFSPNTFKPTSNSWFVSVPQPRRETGTTADPDSPEALLDENQWGTSAIGVLADIGDYTDLLRNARPVLHNCSDLTIEVVSLGDPAPHTAAGTVTTKWAAPGAYVDGRPYAEQDSRPSVIRIRFTLNDPRTSAAATYSFSVTAPTPTRN